MILPREAPDGVVYADPSTELNAGIWTLFTGASVFLGLRLYTKFSRHTGLWYDDYILITSWLVLLVNNIIISIEFATGYVTEGGWDDRMHILINVSSCGTLVGQALSKTAFAVTLLRMSNRNQKVILWICIGSMNGYMAWKCVFQWAKLCGRSDYQQWYRLQTGCINYAWEQDFKEGGNVLNIIMDFVFALFPWWITWPLEMKKMEKVGLCVTMSLGMIVAIVSAIRTGWKDTAGLHKHDSDYMVRNATSMIWYSSEVAGTIIVQCIPILRPFIRDIHNSLTSKRFADTNDPEGRSNSATWRSTVDGKRGSGSAYSDGKRISAYKNHGASGVFDGNGKSGKIGMTTEIVTLSDIPEDREHESVFQPEHELEDKELDPRYRHEHEHETNRDDGDGDSDTETEREIMGWKKGFASKDLEETGRNRQARSQASSDMESKTPTMPAGPLHPGDYWCFSEASTDVHSASPASGGGSWMDFMERGRERERNREGDEEKSVGGDRVELALLQRNSSRGGR